MMRLLVLAALAAALSGCAVVSPRGDPAGIFPASTGYDSPYANAPAYRPPIYMHPPVRLTFRLQFWSGRGGHHWHRHGFRPHRFGGWRGGWKR